MPSTSRSNPGCAARTAAAGPIILKKYGRPRPSTIAPTITQLPVRAAESAPMAMPPPTYVPGDVDRDDTNAMHGLFGARVAADVVELRDPSLDVRIRAAAGARYVAHLDATRDAVRCQAHRIGVGRLHATPRASSRQEPAPRLAADGIDACGRASPLRSRGSRAAKRGPVRRGEFPDGRKWLGGSVLPLVGRQRVVGIRQRHGSRCAGGCRATGRALAEESKSAGGEDDRKGHERRKADRHGCWSLRDSCRRVHRYGDGVSKASSAITNSSTFRGFVR